MSCSREQCLINQFNCRSYDTKTKTRIHQCIVGLSDVIGNTVIYNRLTRYTCCDECLSIGPMTKVLCCGFSQLCRIWQWEYNWTFHRWCHLFYYLLVEHTWCCRCTNKYWWVYSFYRIVKVFKRIRILKLISLTYKTLLTIGKSFCVLEQKSLLVN